MEKWTQEDIQLYIEVAEARVTALKGLLRGASTLLGLCLSDDTPENLLEAVEAWLSDVKKETNHA